MDGPGDRGGLGKEDVVLIRAEFLCADKRIGADAAARTQAYAEIVAQHGTQQKLLDQVAKDIKEEPELAAQLEAKITAKAAELCPDDDAAAEPEPDATSEPAVETKEAVPTGDSEPPSEGDAGAE
jgi:hypothetical protein